MKDCLSDWMRLTPWLVAFSVIVGVAYVIFVGPMPNSGWLHISRWWDVLALPLIVGSVLISYKLWVFMVWNPNRYDKVAKVLLTPIVAIAGSTAALITSVFFGLDATVLVVMGSWVTWVVVSFLLTSALWVLGPIRSYVDGKSWF